MAFDIRNQPQSTQAAGAPAEVGGVTQQKRTSNANAVALDATSAPRTSAGKSESQKNALQSAFNADPQIANGVVQAAKSQSAAGVQQSALSQSPQIQGLINFATTWATEVSSHSPPLTQQQCLSVGKKLDNLKGQIQELDSQLKGIPEWSTLKKGLENSITKAEGSLSVVTKFRAGLGPKLQSAKEESQTAIDIIKSLPTDIATNFAKAKEQEKAPIAPQMGLQGAQAAPAQPAQVKEKAPFEFEGVKQFLSDIRNMRDSTRELSLDPVKNQLATIASHIQKLETYEKELNTKIKAPDGFLDEIGGALSHALEEMYEVQKVLHNSLTNTSQTQDVVSASSDYSSILKGLYDKVEELTQKGIPESAPSSARRAPVLGEGDNLLQFSNKWATEPSFNLGEKVSSSVLDIKKSQFKATLNARSKELSDLINEVRTKFKNQPDFREELVNKLLSFDQRLDKIMDSWSFMTTKENDYNKLRAEFQQYIEGIKDKLK